MCEEHLDQECDTKILIDQMRNKENRLDNKQRQQHSLDKVYFLEDNNQESHAIEEKFVNLDDINDVEVYIIYIIIGNVVPHTTLPISINVHNHPTYNNILIYLNDHGHEVLGIGSVDI